MIRHVVVFTWSADADEQQRATSIQALLRLRQDVGGMESLVVADDAGRYWWQMEYTVTGGPLNERNVFDVDPIEVDVAYGGTVESYVLPWSVRDTCRQANHGC